MEKIIDRLIKFLVDYKYKHYPFMVFTWNIDESNEIHILTAKYYNDHFRYGIKENYYKDIAHNKLNIIKDIVDDSDNDDRMFSGEHYLYEIKKILYDYEKSNK